jgi:transmembrane sensor
VKDPIARARQLIPGRLDELATDEEIAELDRLLIEHPEVAQELAAVATLESSLEIVLGAADEGGEATPIAFAPASAGSARTPVARRIAAAAVGILAVAAVAVIVWSIRSNGDGPQVAARDGLRSDPANLLRFADGSTAELKGADSRIKTRSATSDLIDLDLVRGSARFDVVPRARRQFRIWVGAMRVEVVGTAFTVERLATSARVSVERGSVRVVSGASETLLTPGSAEIVPLPDLPTVSPRPSPPVPPAPTEARTRHKADEPRALLAAAERARRAEQLDEAIVLLRRIVDQHPRDPRAPYAAFILGRVLLDELGRPREAAEAFARVGGLDPRTPLLPDALAREGESWSRAGELARAEARGREYLSRYPDGRRIREVRRYSRIE